MDNDPLTRRRRFLQTAGVGGTALLAGCTDLLGSEDEELELDDELPDVEDESEPDTDDEDDGIELEDGDTREVGMVAQVDEQALQTLQMEIQTGDIEQEEAQQRQEEIIEEGIDALVDAIEADTTIEVNERLTQLGAIRVTGDASDLVDAINSPRATALVPAADLTVQQPSG